MSITTSETTKQYAWLLAVICLLTLFPFLGEALFNTRGEPREALVAMSMINDGNWVLPINCGTDMAYKPPFFHWMIASVSLLSGGVSEFTARFPSAVALTLMTLAGYIFYARRRNPEIALLMGLITLTNFEVHRAGVACRVDMVLTLMMVGALYLLYRWVEGGFRRLPWLGIVCLSGAFLSKGPVGAALPCLVLLVFCWLRGYGFWKSLCRFFGIGLLSCVIPLIWYVAAYRQGGQRFLDLVYEENVLRLLGKMNYASHENPWPYNIQTIVAGFVPYTLLVLMSLFTLRLRRPMPQPVALLWNKLKYHVRTVDSLRLFTFLSFAIIFVFYCIPKSKRSVYLLPVYPFLAYYMALYMVWLRDNRPQIVRWFGRILCGLALLLPIVFLIVRLGVIPETIFSGSHADSNIAMLRSLSESPIDLLGYVAMLIPLLAVYYYWRGNRQSATVNCFSLVGVVLAIFFSLDGLYQPLVLNAKSDKAIAEQIKTIVPEGRFYSYRSDIVPGNRMHPFTINFYLGDRIVPFDVYLPKGEGYVLMGDDAVETFRKTYPDYEIGLTADLKHRSCDDHRRQYLYHFSKRVTSSSHE